MIYSDNCSSASPPISPTTTIESTSSRSRINSKESIRLVPFIGSPPMPNPKRWPYPDRDKVK